MGDREPLQRVWLTLEVLCILLGGHLRSLSKSGWGLGSPQGQSKFPSGSPGPGTLVISSQAGLGLGRGGQFSSGTGRVSDLPQVWAF